MLRRRESVADKLYRYRGVATVVAVPVVLILLIVLVMPRSAPKMFGGGEVAETLAEEAEGKATRIKAPTGTETYAVVFDAGSTGSRVHIYKFVEDEGEMVLQGDTFDQLKPGLSAYPETPDDAAKSLEPLLKLALKTVPENLQKSTKLKLGATAGLRLLKEGQADAILASVKKYLAASPFQMDDKTGVTILDGTMEGGFAWLTLNYLLGKLGQQESETVAAIDLGGGSVQQAFAISQADAKAAPDGYIIQLAGGPQMYNVYVHSYLGFGLMAGRAAVLDWEDTRAANPCIPNDHAGTYEYGGKTYQLAGSSSGAAFDACSKVVKLVLKLDADCGAPVTECAFNGAWGGGPKRPSAIYVSSYFWDRAVEAGVITESDAITWQLKGADVIKAGDKACGTPLSEMGSAFPLVDSKQLPYLCLDLSFQHTLLTEGFHIPDATPITLVKRVQYKGQEVEAAWPLGAAINLLSDSHRG
ncbi:hypothetical protein WJX73_002786 [Symbiochloris irregularis]|uniref:Apyrase n=1 Tax=Symbiochloris irregularis TaxID=706552 RepID=A0AAW1NTB0_9CHLO